MSLTRRVCNSFSMEYQSVIGTTAAAGFNEIQEHHSAVNKSTMSEESIWENPELALSQVCIVIGEYKNDGVIKIGMENYLNYSNKTILNIIVH